MPTGLKNRWEAVLIHGKSRTRTIHRAHRSAQTVKVERLVIFLFRLSISTSQRGMGFGS
jgi:hypothetical protein